MGEIHDPRASGTTKPDDEPGRAGDQRPEGHVFHTAGQAVIKTYESTPMRQQYGNMAPNFAKIKSVIDDSNRRRNKIGLGFSGVATAPLILVL